MTSTPPVPRRVPSQRRSRERLERILDAARALVVERGSEALRMSDLAQRAGIGIGSLYQYFPDRAAVVAALVERHHAAGLACTAAELDAVRTEADLGPALGRVADGFRAMYRDAPELRDLWAATQADRTLQALDEADERAHAALLGGVLARLRPDAPPDARDAAARLLVHLLAATVRLAVALDGTHGAGSGGAALLDAFRRGVLRRPLDALDPML